MKTQILIVFLLALVILLLLRRPPVAAEPLFWEVTTRESADETVTVTRTSNHL